jgi:hypothetical protein
MAQDIDTTSSGGAAAGLEELGDRPEVLVAAAFAGGLLLAIVLRAVGND